MDYYQKYIKYKNKYISLKNNNSLQTGGYNHATVILITRQISYTILERLKKLLALNIRAYIMCDNKPIYSDKSLSKYILYYSNKKMAKLGWTGLYLPKTIHKITAWDKGTYFAYKLNLPYVWIIEDDVYWNNYDKIKELLEINNDADLISYPLHDSYIENPNWYHWKHSNQDEITLDKNKWSTSFNQITRLSNRLLKRIAELAILRKRLYFHEVMFITLCKINNYKIVYLSDLKLDLYINIRWDKPFTENQVKEYIEKNKNILLHPVKYNL
uniref:Glycosyltransferase n=1 Tax=viral metagenome TaxID=1070528 RepID=A0A6C0GZW7_9ZZZZ